MKNLTKVLTVATVATMALSGISAIAAEIGTTADFERPAFAMNMKVKDSNFKLGKRLEFTKEQKAAMAEKFASGEFKPILQNELLCILFV